MSKLLTSLIGLIGALWLGIAGVALAEWWEHRAAGEPQWAQVHVLWFSWQPPMSLAAQLEKAQADYKIAHDNEKQLNDAIWQQNKAVEHLSEVSRQLTDQNARLVAASATQATAARLASQAIASAPAEAGECGALAGSDRAFVTYLGTLK